MTQPTAAKATTGNLALIFQELFTAIVRLRSNRQSIPDAEFFRQHIREAVRKAAQEARNPGGYSHDDIKMATLAVVGFLDETVLNLQNPIFASWPSKPLQEELFNEHIAGEVFFGNVRELLRRDDSPAVADVLEVHYLCLLLGYRGRYSLDDRGELRSILEATGTKIRRIRGPQSDLSPQWAPPPEQVSIAGDRWSRRLAAAAIACAVLTAVLFLVYQIVLRSAVSGLSS
ncbi:MAG TPA: DotU family type IV/VI secretion system protein [Bryobacteraceae bacterium]|nr:DotU family type IV/VI secretion system protein [Bryobacteraceae bacterium]